MALDPRSTLKRPPKALLSRFHLGMIGPDTVRTFLEKGYSLAICCRDCTREPVEWTPHELLERFGSRLDVPIVEIAKRLSCTGDEGCGSKSIAVFPHLYDLPWEWEPPA